MVFTAATAKFRGQGILEFLRINLEFLKDYFASLAMTEFSQ